jgi:adenylate cyclase
MFTDIVGYTALTQSNEALAMEVLERHNRLLRPFFPRFQGREVKTIGDSFLVEFESALDALKCATEIQTYLHDYNVSSKEEWRIKLRIGIHLGDVIHRANDVFGDAVNLASRIEPLAEPEGVCVSDQVFGQIRNKVPLAFVKMAPQALKNVQFPIDIYKVVMHWDQQAPPKEEPSFPRDRIAILPFRNMSPDPSDEYFAEGMTEEIISTVSGISGLSVISRTSVMGYKGSTKKVKEIGKELDVGSVLEGSLRKAGNKIRVTAQLIDVAGDKHLWAQNYDRDLDDVFAVQSDVAKQVAEALRVRILSPEMERIEKKPTESTNAYTLYLKGRHLWNKRGVENVKKAREYFELAVHEDPDFVLGYVGLADCYLILKDLGFDMEANLERARSMVVRALELDPGLAEAHATKGLMLKNEYKPQLAEEEFRDSIRLKPSYATAHQWYFGLLLDQLRWDEALEQVERAVELDPLSPVINYNHGIFHFAKRDYGRAIELFKKVTALDPNYPPVHVLMVSAYGRMKMHEELRREVETAAKLLKGAYPSGLDLWVASIIARWEDDRETLRRLMPELEAYANEPGPAAVGVAARYFYLGENDKGFEWLERAFSRKEDLSDIKWDPDLDGVRADPRYLDLLRRLGLD